MEDMEAGELGECHWFREPLGERIANDEQSMTGIQCSIENGDRNNEFSHS